MILAEATSWPEAAVAIAAFAYLTIIVWRSSK